MDSDIQKILDAAAVMKERFKAMEKRQALSKEKYDAVASAANTFRWFDGIELAKLRMAFDPDYKAELENMTKKVKGISD